MNCSAVLIVKNARETLAGTLHSLHRFPEVIVYDTGSDDDSRAIAAEFSNVRLIDGYFDGFGNSKNRAVDCAAHDWVFSIDADETVTERLAAALAAFPEDEPHAVGIVLRENQFCGKTIRVGGWGNDRLVRLFNRRVYRFSDRPVHESVVLDQRAVRISVDGVLRHAAVTDVGQFLIKIERYSALAAGRLARKPFPVIVAKSLFAFLRSYFLKRGFVAGWRGFTIAWCNAIGVYFKYLRAYTKKE